jgi:type IV secretory pathway VirB2 component (pilin)
MISRELKAFAAVSVGSLALLAIVAIGLKLLGANSEEASVGFVVTMAVAAFASAFAFDRYSTPPDQR